MEFIIFRCTIYDKIAKKSSIGEMSLQCYKSYIINKGLYFLKYFGIQESLTKK